MEKPCRSCPRQTIDGGCHCQAFLRTGDATASVPLCHRLPEHHLITKARESGQPQSPSFRYSDRTISNSII